MLKITKILPRQLMKMYWFLGKEDWKLKNIFFFNYDLEKAFNVFLQNMTYTMNFGMLLCCTIVQLIIKQLRLPAVRVGGEGLDDVQLVLDLDLSFLYPGFFKGTPR